MFHQEGLMESGTLKKREMSQESASVLGFRKYGSHF
jgi:hypothetical protein